MLTIAKTANKAQGLQTAMAADNSVQLHTFQSDSRSRIWLPEKTQRQNLLQVALSSNSDQPQGTSVVSNSLRTDCGRSLKSEYVHK